MPGGTKRNDPATLPHSVASWSVPERRHSEVACTTASPLDILEVDTSTSRSRPTPRREDTMRRSTVVSVLVVGLASGGYFALQALQDRKSTRLNSSHT